MNLTWSNDLSGLDWNELSKLFKIAPLGDKSAEHLKRVFGNSLFKIVLFDKDKLIGAGRALADGADCSYICDVVIHPEYQGKSLGKQLVERLINASKGHKKIILYSNPGKEGFYLKMGFKYMNTAMAIFEDEEAALQAGFVRQEP